MEIKKVRMKGVGTNQISKKSFFVTSQSRGDAADRYARGFVSLSEWGRNEGADWFRVNFVGLTSRETGAGAKSPRGSKALSVTIIEVSIGR